MFVVVCIGSGSTVVFIGEVPEWPKGTDCKSVGVSLRRFETSPPHHSREVQGPSEESGVEELEI